MRKLTLGLAETVQTFRRDGTHPARDRQPDTAVSRRISHTISQRERLTNSLADEAG
jgi:hypothetical protein